MRLSLLFQYLSGIFIFCIFSTSLSYSSQREVSTQKNLPPISVKNLAPLVKKTNPIIQTPTHQKAKKSFKEKFIMRWIQKKVAKAQRKETKNKKSKGFPIDAAIGLGLSSFAAIYAAILFIFLGPYLLLPSSIIYAIIAAVAGGLLGAIANARLSKKENPSRTGKVFAKIAFALGFGILGVLLLEIGIIQHWN